MFPSCGNTMVLFVSANKWCKQSRMNKFILNIESELCRWMDRLKERETETERERWKTGSGEKILELTCEG